MMWPPYRLAYQATTLLGLLWASSGRAVDVASDLLSLPPLPLDTTTTPLLPVPATVHTLLKRPVRYDDLQMWRVQRTAAVDSALKQLAARVDIWHETGDTVELAVRTADADAVNATLSAVHALVSSRPADYIQRAIDAETSRLKLQVRTSHLRLNLAMDLPRINQQMQDWFNEYHSYDDIVFWCRWLSSHYPELVKYTPSIGRTHEGRDIPMLTITAPGDAAPRKRVWMQALQHAREWISGTTLQYVAYHLVDEYASNARIKSLLSKVEFVMIPIVNPDGYVFTWTTDRLWRKNRRRNNVRSRGVDLNRNWPDHWSLEESSGIPSSIIYPGPSPGSEPEVQALMRLYTTTPNVVATLDLHAYGNLLLRPYGWGDVEDQAEDQYRALADILVTDLHRQRQTRYTSQRVFELYQATGVVTDWWAGAGQQARQQQFGEREATRPYSFTIELSPEAKDSSGDAEFILHPRNIVPVGQEVLPMVLHYAELASNHPLRVVRQR